MTEKQEKKVLVIAHHFPPVGGAGVQRVTKFVKYLSLFKWQPTVLTVSNPSVPVFDVSMRDEVPESVEIVEARTLEPGYETKNSLSASAARTTKASGLRVITNKMLRRLANLMLQPDPQILWLPAAYKRGKALLKASRFDVILVSAPPFSSFVLGALLCRNSSVPLVLDYRDEWGISNASWENRDEGRISRFVQSKLQRFAVNRASALIATTEMSAESLRETAKLSTSEPPVYCLYNGYDSADFNFERSEKFRVAEGSYHLSYVGTLWNLTSIAPIVEAIIQLEARRPELSSRIVLSVAGRCTAEQQSVIDQLVDTRVTVNQYNYLPHNDALQLMMNSDGLCLLLSDFDYAGRVVPAKLFEYVASRNTIFVAAPEGEIWNLLRGYSRAYLTRPSEVEQLTANLEGEITHFLSGSERPYDDFDHTRFERKNLTKDLVSILDRASALQEISAAESDPNT